METFQQVMNWFYLLLIVSVVTIAAEADGVGLAVSLAGVDWAFVVKILDSRAEHIVPIAMNQTTDDVVPRQPALR